MDVNRRAFSLNHTLFNLNKDVPIKLKKKKLKTSVRRSSLSEIEDVLFGELKMFNPLKSLPLLST